MTDISGIPHKLKKNTCDLATVGQHIIWPLQARSIHSDGLKGTHDRQTHHKAQAFQLPHATVDTQH
ncbi:hypothetical protein D3C78_1931210 [compost metagenome]